jgi:hypothetical protein
LILPLPAECYRHHELSNVRIVHGRADGVLPEVATLQGDRPGAGTSS